MIEKTTSSRRSFLKNGAILAVPLAAAAAPAAVLADDGLKARLAKLEDEAAVRELHQSWLRAINGGDRALAGDAAAPARSAATPRFADAEAIASGHAVRSIAADHAAEPDTIEITDDGKHATGRFHCVAEIETPLAKDCTLAQMAHAQGSGFVRSIARRVLNVEYAKTNSAWSIVKAEFAQG